jgi:hypothetical protein
MLKSYVSPKLLTSLDAWMAEGGHFVGFQVNAGARGLSAGEELESGGWSSRRGVLNTGKMPVPLRMWEDRVAFTLC